MALVKTQESHIKTPNGILFVKEWLPNKLVSDVPIIMLHDSLGSVKLWRDFPEMLATTLSRRIVAYDRLGFGQSDIRIESPTVDFIKEEASIFFPEIKKHLLINKYILLGHSVGGGMSLNIAANDKDCTAVISISAQAFVEDITLQGIKAAKKMFEKAGQVERLEKWHGNKATWVLKAWIDTWLSPDFLRWNLNYCLPDITCPVLIIHGDNDEYGTIAFPEFIANKVLGCSTTLIIQNCGHFPHKEKTNEVSSAIVKFLS